MPSIVKALGRLRHKRELLFLAVSLTACILFFFPRWADWNQNSRLNLVRAIVDDQSLMIDKYVENTGDYAYFGGHYYSDKAPGMAFMGVPAYAVFRALVPRASVHELQVATAGRSSLTATLKADGAGLGGDRIYTFLALVFLTATTAAVPSVILGMVFFWMCTRFGCSARQSMAASLLFCLATNAFPYSNAFVGHQPAALFLFAAFAILFLFRSGGASRRWLLAAGFLLGCAAITEYQTVLIGATLAVYALLTARERIGALIRLSAGALPPVAILVVYDLAAFGTPLPVGYGYSALWADVHGTGFLSLTYPKLDALWGITFGMHRGLFFLSPFLLFAIPGYAAIWRNRDRRPEFWVLALAPAAFFLFNASSAMWTGGFAVGPRYLVPSLPFLGLAAGIGISGAWSSPAMRPAIILACAWSFFAVWAETIAGQAFPDYTLNPLFDLSIPRLVGGDIARNAGMLLGLSSWASLLPLVLILCGAMLAMLTSSRPSSSARSSTLREMASDHGVGR